MRLSFEKFILSARPQAWCGKAPSEGSSRAPARPELALELRGGA